MNILLVDDDKVAHFINQKILASLGNVDCVFTAYNGLEALKFFENAEDVNTLLPQIILLDINMPVMDGFEFIKAFQKLNFKRKNEVLIILLSSSNSLEDIRYAMSLGVKYFLSKPIRSETINSILSEEFRFQEGEI